MPQNKDLRVDILRTRIVEINRELEENRKFIANTARENRMWNRRIRKLEKLAQLAGFTYGSAASNLPKSPKSRTFGILRICKVCGMNNHIRDKSCKKCGANRAIMARGVYRKLARV